MKKMTICKVALSALIAVLVPLTAAWAFLPMPPMPWTPTVDVAGDAGAAQEGQAKTSETLQDTYQKYAGDTLNKIKSMDLKFPLKLDASLFNKKKGEPNIPTARNIETSKIADIKDEASIIEAFQTLFLIYPDEILKKYPKDEEGIKKSYKDKAVEFSNDSMIELYISVRGLEERMVALKAELDALSACYVQGEKPNPDSCESASPNDEEVGMWSNYYKVNVVYDSLLKVAEELTAIKAQYEVTQALRAGIEPRDLEREKELLEEEQVSFNFHVTSKLAFAQMFTAEKSVSEAKKLSNNLVASPQKESFGGIAITNKKDVLNPNLEVVKANTQVEKSPFVGVENQIKDSPRDDNVHAELGVAQDIRRNNVEATSKKEAFGGIAITNKRGILNPNLEVVKAKPHIVESPFVGTENQFKDSLRADNVYKELGVAQEVHNLKQQLDDYRRVFVEYGKMKQLHEKAVEKLRLSEQCVVNYLGKYYASPENVWLGSGCKYSGNNVVCDSDRFIGSTNLKDLSSGDVLCADNKSKICSNYGINSYSNRGGMSGWLVSAYKAAKAEKVLDLNVESFAENLSDGKITGEISDFSAQSDAYFAEMQSNTMDSSLLKPSDEPKIEADNREQELIAWQIGAEAAKALGEDMQSAAPKWGVATAAYPIWNDEKYFYDQYLDEKYNNMKNYIRQLDLRQETVDLAMEIVQSIVSTETNFQDESIASIQSYSQDLLSKLSGMIAADAGKPKAETALEKLQKTSDATIDNLRRAFNAKMVSLDNTKDSVYQNIDSKNIELNEDKKAYNTAAKEQQFAEADTVAQQQVITISQMRKARHPEAISGFEDRAEQSIVQAKQQITSAKEAQEKALSQLDVKRDALDELNLRLDVANEGIIRSKSDYAANAAALEAKNMAAMEAAVAEISKDKTTLSLGNSSYLAEVLKKASDKDSVKMSVFKAIVGLADGLVADARDAAIAQIDKGQKEIAAMGDARYEPKSHQQILSIHRGIINGIKTPNIKAQITSLWLSPILSPTAIGKAVNDVFAQSMQSRLCQEDSCYNSDTQYFVALAPKAEDFVAPKIISTTPTAPLREIVHFDTTDYDNVVKSDALMTTRHDFLNYGQEMPPIWKRILEPKGFVEKDVNVEKILANGKGAEDALLRGGLYPCSVGKYDVDINQGGYYVSPSSGRLPVCANIRSINLLGSSGQIVLKDGTAVSISGSGQQFKNSKASELSMLLKYTSGLTFNDKIKEIVDFYENLEVSDNPEDYDAKGKEYERALLTRNQFGNFLGFVEVETEYQKAVDKLKIKVDENRKTLKAKFAKIDYVPADDFDLANDATFAEITSVLDRSKNQIVSKAVSDLENVQPSNDVVAEKLQKSTNISQSLQLDKDEVVKLSDNMSGDSVLSEKVKSKQVDNQVRSEYEKEAEAEFKKNLTAFEEPYCAVY